MVPMRVWFLHTCGLYLYFPLGQDRVYKQSWILLCPSFLLRYEAELGENKGQHHVRYIKKTPVRSFYPALTEYHFSSFSHLKQQEVLVRETKREAGNSRRWCLLQ